MCVLHARKLSGVGQLQILHERTQLQLSSPFMNLMLNQRVLRCCKLPDNDCVHALIAEPK